MSGLMEWMRAALEVADSEDMPDSEVIPTWPELLVDKYPDMYPPLKVGHLREWRSLADNSPAAWLHQDRKDSDVITDAVRNAWGKPVPAKLAQYSIPLYGPSVLQ